LPTAARTSGIENLDAQCQQYNNIIDRTMHLVALQVEVIADSSNHLRRSEVQIGFHS
jgi:hypothetical protein